MENQENLSLESTTSKETTTETEVNETSNLSESQEQSEFNSGIEQKNDGNENKETNSEPAPFLTVRYNHADKGLTESEAITLAQKGMAYDPLYESLQRAAALKGVDIKTFISSAEREAEEKYRAELEEKYGEDSEAIDALMEIYRSKKEKTINEAKSNTENQKREKQEILETRLANEFVELKKEFPEIEKFEDLPNSVKTEAAEGKDLLFAYLKHKHQENKKIEASKAKQQVVAKSSVGSLQSAEKEGAFDALMQGLYG